MIDKSTLAGSTLEILSLLAVAFLLGYLLKLLMGNKWKTLYKNREEENIKLTNEFASNNSKIKSLEDSNKFLRLELEKAKRSKPLIAPVKSTISSSLSNGNAPAKPKSPVVAVPEKKTIVRPIKNSTNSAIKKTSPKPDLRKTSKPKSVAKKTQKTKDIKKTATKKQNRKDDLKKVEGIGPKIEQIFNKAGIKSFDDLAGYTPTKLKKILSEAGPRYKMHDPKTWPRQAKLASSGNWKRLKTLQDSLKGGRA